MARASVVRLAWAALGPLALALAGCGDGGTRSPSISAVPLPPGARVVARFTSCDAGANAYCAISFVVVDDSYSTSDALLSAERRRLHASRWSDAHGDIGDESAAESPGNALRLTYATAYGDLKGTEELGLHRPQPIQVALSRTMFARQSAISMLLEAGPG